NQPGIIAIGRIPTDPREQQQQRLGENCEASSMYRSPKYPTPPDLAEEFVQSMRHGTIIAAPADGFPQVSILPFVKTGEEIELHFVQLDPTFQALQADPRCTFLVSDFLAFTPHHFVDPDDAGRATLHFRAVAYECEARFISSEPADVAGALSRLLAHPEPSARGSAPARQAPGPSTTRACAWPIRWSRGGTSSTRGSSAERLSSTAPG